MLKYHNSYYKIWKASFSARRIVLHFGHKSLRKGIYSVHADTLNYSIEKFNPVLYLVMKCWLLPLKNKARHEKEAQDWLGSLVDIINNGHKTGASSSQELQWKNSFCVEDRSWEVLPHQL